jgi:hypothetical protein
MVRTDNAALTYVGKFADQNSRLMRWSLKLSEFDFTVEHRAETKNPYVDALSRRVGTILHEGSFDPEAVRLEEAYDKFCQILKPGTYASKYEFFYKLALVYRRRPDDRHQLLVTKTLVNDVIKENYDPVLSCIRDLSEPVT